MILITLYGISYLEEITSWVFFPQFFTKASATVKAYNMTLNIKFIKMIYNCKLKKKKKNIMK